MLRFHGKPGTPGALRIAALPAAYNPPTMAHLEIVKSLSAMVDEVLLVMPTTMPHKRFDGASYEQRLAMLTQLTLEENCRVCSAPGGLLVEIATACREVYPRAEIAIAYGRDAAERALTWRYRDPASVETLFALAELWVFARQGNLHPPARWQQRVRVVPFPDELQQISATEIRRRIACGEGWRHLAPPEIHTLAAQIYAEG